MSEEPKDAATQSGGPVPPNRRWLRIAKPVAGGAVLVLVILWSVGVFRTRTPPGRLEHLPGLPVPPNADLFTVKQESIAVRVDVVGTVTSETKVDISARIPACVKEVFVSAGTPVKKGQDLVALDDREIREQVAGAEAQFKQAETEFNRAKQLFDNKATTEQALTAAQSLFTAARAQFDRSKVMLSYAAIASPMDGIVTDRRVEAGDQANPGQVLLAIYDPTNMQLEAPVPVRLLDQVPVGQAVEVVLDRPAASFQGHVRQIVSEVDPLSRTQLVKVHIEKVGGIILPGTFGRLWVNDEACPTFLVPASAVYSVGQIDFVHVVREQRAIRRAVRTGPRHEGSVEVLSGLAAGDVVLTRPIKED